ncbi:hypothetical protein ACFWA9_04270 [Kitasatospora sp. NPDC059973]|uniref:hypothetical protein n=1 Tax=Kitasatospora sp. NPDC059973 TaxID=3347020 RepID=UPI00369E8C76
MTKSLQYDTALAAFVSITEASSFEVSITLTTTGGVVTGRLVSGTKWAELNIELLKEANGDVAGLNQFYDFYLKKLTGEAEEIKTIHSSLDSVKVPDDYREAIASVSRPAYIHLQDARILGPSGLVPSGPAAPWRGRLAEVVGWSLGEIQG